MIADFVLTRLDASLTDKVARADCHFGLRMFFALRVLSAMSLALASFAVVSVAASVIKAKHLGQPSGVVEVGWKQGDDLGVEVR